MKKIIVIVLVVILLSMELVVGTAIADEPTSQSGESEVVSLASIHPPVTLDGTWVILDQNMPVGGFFSGGPWTWDLPSLPVKFTITDLYVVSDQFAVYDNDIPVVTTPSLPDWDVLKYATAFSSPPWTNDPDVALDSNFFSSAVIIFPRGEHSITIQDIHIPPRTAGGKPCSDGTVAFKAEQIDIGIAIIDIDIKPGSDHNTINLSNKGVIPVAILGSTTFDVTSVEVSSLKFGPGEANPVHDLTDPLVHAKHLQDVNLDGFVDLVSHYKTKETGISSVATTAMLLGNLSDGTSIEGIDSVRIVKP
jgi:hypothetical protein